MQWFVAKGDADGKGVWVNLAGDDSDAEDVWFHTWNSTRQQGNQGFVQLIGSYFGDVFRLSFVFFVFMHRLGTDVSLSMSLNFVVVGPGRDR